MSNKKLESLLQKLSDASSELRSEIEPLTDADAEEIAGGTDVNVGCPNNSGCNPGCTVGGPK